MPSPQIQQKLHGLLQYAVNLLAAVDDLLEHLSRSYDLKKSLKQSLTKCELLNQLLTKGLDLFYGSFNNIVGSLMECSLHTLVATKAYLYELVKDQIDLPLVDQVVGLQSKSASYAEETTLLCRRGSESSQERQCLYETHLLWLL